MRKLKYFLFLLLFALIISGCAKQNIEQTTGENKPTTPLSSENGVYIISSENDLLRISENPDANYKLGADIKINAFMPIGRREVDKNKNFSFGGTLDGNGHKITIANLCESKNLLPDENEKKYSYAALFANIKESGNVKNLFVEAFFDINSSNSLIGGIAGSNLGEISNCQIKLSGKINGDSNFIGGITGSGDNINRSSAFIDFEINGNFCYAGGLTGAGAKIINSYSSGNIKLSGTQDNLAGGISASSMASIGSCYSKVDITLSGSNSYAGGIAGFVEGYGTIENCVVLGDITFQNNASANRIVGDFLKWENKGPGTYNPNTPEIPFKNNYSILINEILKPDLKYDTYGLDFMYNPPQKSDFEKIGFKFGNNNESPWIFDNTNFVPLLYFEN